MSGLYQIVLTYEGMVVPGSPFTFCVFDPDAITVCPFDPVACNELVEFTGESCCCCASSLFALYVQMNYSLAIVSRHLVFLAVYLLLNYLA